MGDVWEAQDIALARRVAVKLLKTSENEEEALVARTRFVREAHIAAALRHPNIVMALDVGEASGRCFFVMELVEGRPLRSLLRERIPLEDKLRWLREIADALATMHDAGIVHRDVKPENVIIRTNGSACLVDLSIAKWMRADEAPITQRPSRTGAEEDVIVGTPDYLPPETCYAGVFDELGDQYAFGVMAYELLAGAHPSEILDRKLTDRGDIPAAIALTIERARSRLPRGRYPTMRALCSSLGMPSARASDQPLVVDVPDEAAPETVAAPKRKKGSSLTLVFAAAFVTLVMHGILLGVAHRRRSTPAAPPASAVSAIPSASTAPAR